MTIGSLARLRLAMFAAAAIALSDSSYAHTRSESYSAWQTDNDRIIAVITVSTGEVAALMTATDPQPLDTLLASELTRSVAVFSAAGPCLTGTPAVLAAARGFQRVEIAFECDGRAPERVRYRALMDALPAHVHYARLFHGGQLLAETVLTDRADLWKIATQRSPASFTSYLGVGVRHILSGIDHIAFLLGMLLVAGTLGRSIAAVTGFTLGHSISLAAAVLGYVQVDGRLVEAFIGFTVALVAVEYCVGNRGRKVPILAVMLVAWATGVAALAAGTVTVDLLTMYFGFGLFAACYLGLSARLATRTDASRWGTLFLVTACFGVIHGFGFAGFLMDTGISGTTLAISLVGFNLGVELGQLALVAAAFLLASALRHTSWSRLAPAATAGLCGIGVYWFVGRSLGA